MFEREEEKRKNKGQWRPTVEKQPSIGHTTRSERERGARTLLAQVKWALRKKGKKTEREMRLSLWLWMVLWWARVGVEATWRARGPDCSPCRAGGPARENRPGKDSPPPPPPPTSSLEQKERRQPLVFAGDAWPTNVQRWRRWRWLPDVVNWKWRSEVFLWRSHRNRSRF